MTVSSASTKAQMKQEWDMLVDEFDDIKLDLMSAKDPAERKELHQQQRDVMVRMTEYRTYYRQIREFLNPGMVFTTDNQQPTDPWKD